MFNVFKNRLELTGILTTVTALRIGAGRSTEPIGSELPVIKDALGKPLIPGSSFKGALRSRLQSFRKLQVRDLTVLADAWFGQYQERDGVAIERDTETAAEGKLYDSQVVPRCVGVM